MASSNEDDANSVASTSEATPLTKILVCGDVEGNFKFVFEKVVKIMRKKGPIEMMFCVGSFFGSNNEEWDDVKSGKIEIPLPTYILGPSKPEHYEYYNDINGYEILPNLVYLGKKGVWTGVSGLKVAYISGVENNDSSTGNHIFTLKDAQDIERSVGTDDQVVDVLLSLQWPKNVTKLASIADNVDSSQGSSVLAYLAAKLKPRYHYAAYEGTFYERLPYRNNTVLTRSSILPTRFIALGKSTGSEKWLYGFYIAPLSKLTSYDYRILHAEAGFITANPYENIELSTEASSSSTSERTQYFFEASTSTARRPAEPENQVEPERKRFKLVSAFETDNECWFCLSSPTIEKHLIINVSNVTYLALAKGGLVPEHTLIIPSCHRTCILETTEDEQREIYRYKIALLRCFAREGKTVIFFERFYKTCHLAIQAVPVPRVFRTLIKYIFAKHAATYSSTVTDVPQTSHIKQIIPPKVPYFAFDVEDEDGYLHTSFFLIKDPQFPLQFGREIIVSREVLNLPDRVHWKNCVLSRDFETALCTAMKAKLHDFF